jgi:hypothetical protein
MAWSVLLPLTLDGGGAPAVAGLSRAIQLSVAPVFLFTGVTGLLSLFTSRLARIIDRTRVIQEAQATSLAKPEGDRSEAERLGQVLAVLFISAVAALDVTAIVVPLFVAAMGSMIVGLLLFLLEVQLAISQNPRRYE